MTHSYVTQVTCDLSTSSVDFFQAWNDSHSLQVLAYRESGSESSAMFIFKSFDIDTDSDWQRAAELATLEQVILWTARFFGAILS